MRLEQQNGGRTLASRTERRGSNRFPLQEEVRYRILRPNAIHVATTGKSLDISSGGILFTTHEELPVGRIVEIAVNWPARLDGTCPLQFVAIGHVVRSDAARAAVRIERYEFKTRAVASAAAAT